MNENLQNDNRSQKEKVRDLIKKLLTEKKTGKHPFQQIEILSKLNKSDRDGLPNNELMENTRLLAGLIPNINSRILKKLGLEIKGEVHYKIVKSDDEDAQK